MNGLAYAVLYCAIGMAVSMGAVAFMRSIDKISGEPDVADYLMLSIGFLFWPCFLLVMAPMAAFWLLWMAVRALRERTGRRDTQDTQDTQDGQDGRKAA